MTGPNVIIMIMWRTDNEPIITCGALVKCDEHLSKGKKSCLLENFCVCRRITYLLFQNDIHPIILLGWLLNVIIYSEG